MVVPKEEILQVAKLCYLGSLITDNESCSTQLRLRIAMTNTAFRRRKELFIRTMSQNVKNRSSKLLHGVSFYMDQRRGH